MRSKRLNTLLVLFPDPIMDQSGELAYQLSYSRCENNVVSIWKSGASCPMFYSFSRNSCQPFFPTYHYFGRSKKDLFWSLFNKLLKEQNKICNYICLVSKRNFLHCCLKKRVIFSSSIQYARYYHSHSKSRGHIGIIVRQLG